MCAHVYAHLTLCAHSCTRTLEPTLLQGVFEGSGVGHGDGQGLYREGRAVPQVAPVDEVEVGRGHARVAHVGESREEPYRGKRGWKGGENVGFKGRENVSTPL